MIRYYLFVARWMWKHRYWKGGCQKWKALDRELKAYAHRVRS